MCKRASNSPDVDNEVPPAPGQSVKSDSTFMHTFDNLAPRPKDNFADPDSPIMMISAGFEEML